MSESHEFLKQFQSTFPQIKVRLLFVDNNSTDQSAELLNDFITKSEFKEQMQIISCSEQGYGAALKTGFSFETSDWYAFVDLDNTYPLFSFLPMFKLAQHSKLDMVFANRMVPGSEMNSIRRLGNSFYLFCTKCLFQVRLGDACSGMRLFSHQRKDEVLKLGRNDLSFSIELTAHALKQNWKCLDYPIAYRDRLGESKLSVIKDGWLFLKVLIKAKWAPALKESHVI